MTSSKQIILVVEDEPLLRMAAVDIAESAGFEALGAADATEAIAVLESRTDIRVVFTDIDMPRGIDGVMLAACIRDRWPPVHIVVTSGQLSPSPDMLPAGSLFFSKPYKEKEVVAAFRKMMSG